MFERILVPLNGSERAGRALPVAARVARATNGTLLLLCVVHHSEHLAPSAVPVVMATTAAHDLAHEYLLHISHRADLAGIAIELLLWEGDPASAILDEATARQVSLIVLSSHGRSGLLRWALGSVAEHVVRHAAASVLIVRSNVPNPSSLLPGSEQPQCILIGLDGSTFAEAALAPATALVSALAAPAEGAVHLARVVRRYTFEEQAEQHPELGPPVLPAVDEAKAYLSAVASRLRESRLAPLRVTWSVSISADVAQSLLDVATNGEDAEGAEGTGVYGRCDLVAVTTHGRSGIQRWAVGSIAERILHSCRLPLLVVHAEAVEHSEQQ